MSEDKTRETKDVRSFEERVFARFDSFDKRFDQLEALCLRLDNLIAFDDVLRQRWEEVMKGGGKTNSAESPRSYQVG